MEVRSSEVLLARARRRAAGGDAAGARADLDHAVQQEPDSYRVRLARAGWLISARELAEAKADVEHALELGAGVAALALRGWLALHLDGDPEAAERNLSEAIDAGDRRASNHVTRGWARDARGDHEGALADALQAAARDPLDADARFLVALSRVRLGDRRGIRDLDRAEALYAAGGDQRGRRDVWQLREEIRHGRTPLPAAPSPWLSFGPDPRELVFPRAHTDRRPDGDGLQDHGGARVHAGGGGGTGPRLVIRARAGRLALAAVAAVARFVATVIALGLLTVLPEVSAGPPFLGTVLVASLFYRALHVGASSLLTSLVVLPVGLGHWMQAGPLPLVAFARWLGAAALAALVFAVTGWVTGWVGLDYWVGGPATVLVAGSLLGLGTFVTFPILRRES